MLAICGSLLATPAVQAAPGKVLAIGDSITRGVEGQCSYRRDLSEALKNRSDCDIDFVGPRAEPDGNPPRCQATNTRHAGFPGKKADYFLENGLIDAYMNDYTPDYVLLHIGSNDIAQGDSLSSTIDQINSIIDRTLSGQSNPKLMLANVIPWLGLEAQTGALTSALNELATERRNRGDAVYLVDVASGFDAGSMTIDGVHPDDAGESHMASRFLTTLNSAGICGTPTPEPPALQLANNEWEQISLPADPGVNDRLVDIFDELPMSGYGRSWAVFGTDFTRSDTFVYTTLALNSRLQTGESYWVIQKTGASTTIRMPAGSQPVQTAAITGCAPGTACYTVPLRTNSSQRMWNFIGYPFPASASLANTRMLTSSGGCAEGCTLADAFENNVAGKAMQHYDPESGGSYRQIEDDNAINAWEGLWFSVLPGAHNQSPKVLFAP